MKTNRLLSLTAAVMCTMLITNDGQAKKPNKFQPQEGTLINTGFEKKGRGGKKGATPALGWTKVGSGYTLAKTKTVGGSGKKACQINGSQGDTNGASQEVNLPASVGEVSINLRLKTDNVNPGLDKTRKVDVGANGQADTAPPNETILDRNNVTPAGANAFLTVRLADGSSVGVGGATIVGSQDWESRSLDTRNTDLGGQRIVGYRIDIAADNCDGTVWYDDVIGTTNSEMPVGSDSGGDNDGNDNGGTTIPDHPTTTTTTDTGAFSIVYDDGTADHWSVAKPALETAGLIANFGIVSSYIDDSDNHHMKHEQLLVLQNGGHEIMNHTFTHAHQTSLTQALIAAEFSQCQEELTGWGITAPKGIVAPYGEINDLMITVAQGQGFTSIRSTQSGINPKGATDPWHVKANTIVMQTTTANIDQLVADTKTSKGWLVIVFHNLADIGDPTYRTTIAMHQSILEILANSDLRNLKYSAAVEEFKAP